MGGFELIGPTYIFKNIEENINETCLCNGLIANITEEDEKFLVTNYPKEIPLDFINKFNIQGKHIGKNFLYNCTYNKQINEDDNIFQSSNIRNAPLLYLKLDRMIEKNKELEAMKKIPLRENECCKCRKIYQPHQLYQNKDGTKECSNC
jgi:hypothetical protein